MGISAASLVDVALNMGVAVAVRLLQCVHSKDVGSIAAIRYEPCLADGPRSVVGSSQIRDNATLAQM
jgi:hypothetical protein